MEMPASRSRRHGNSWRAAAAALLAVAALGASAQEEWGAGDVPTLPPVVVTAERREAPELEAAQHVSVVTAGEIAERGCQTTPDALKEEPGVWVQKTGYGGGSPFVRGLTGKQVLLLVDGIRFNNSTFRFGPNQYLNTIDPWIIERIEVVRGPGSVLYGSDALGGVVNVVTRRSGEFGETPQPGVSGRLAGLFSSADRGAVVRLDVEGSSGPVAWTIGASAKDFGDLRAGRGESPVGLVDTNGVQSPSGYTETDYDVRARWVLSPRSELRFAYLHSRQEDVPRCDRCIASDYQTSPERYYYDPQQADFAYVEHESRDIGPVESMKFTVSYNLQLEGRERRRSSWTYTRYEEDEVGTVGFASQVAMKPAGRNSVCFGLEAYADAISSARWDVADGTGTITTRPGRFPDDSAYRSLGVYARDRLALSDRLDLGVGVRYSSFAAELDFGGYNFPLIGPLYEVSESYSDVTWSVEAMWHVNDSSRVYLNIARGFRAPNIDDLAVNGDWSSGYDLPNPELRPEKVVNCELGAKHSGAAASAGASVFYADCTDLIQREYLAPGDDGIPGTGDDLYHFANAARAQMYGGELWGRLRVHRSEDGTWHLFGGVAYVYGQDIAADVPLSKIPPLNGRLGVRWEAPASGRWFEAFAEGAAAQDRLSPSDENDVRIPDGGTPAWVTFNIRGGMRLSKDLVLYLGGYNLGDVRYRVHGSGLDAPGLNVVARVEWRF